MFPGIRPHGGIQMIRLASLLLISALTIAPAWAAPAPKKPTVMKSAKQGDVTYDHQKHEKTRAKLECTECHAAPAGGKIEGLDQKKGHAMCRECHQKDATKKAPTKCTQCHDAATKQKK